MNPAPQNVASTLSRLFRLRLLPLTIVVLVVVLPLRVRVLVEGIPSFAQDSVGFGDHERPWAEDLAAGQSARPAATGSDPLGVVPVETIGQASSDSPPNSPALCGDGELLAALVAQKADLDARARRVQESEDLLAASELRVQAEVERLLTVKRDLEALLSQRSTMEAEDIRRMVAIYETMKPRDAARLLDAMDRHVVVDLLDRMPERRAAPILAEMDATLARDVTRIIMERRRLVGDQTATN